MLILFAPAIATALFWFWIAELNLLQQPGSKLNMILAATVVGTALLAAVEASQLGWVVRVTSPQKGDVVQARLPGFFLLLLWIVAYPAYLYLRSKYGLRNLTFGGIVISLVCVGSYFVLYQAVEEQVRQIQRNLENSQ